MAGGCGRTYRIDAQVDPAACNALQDGAAGLLVPEVQMVPDPGVTVTPPAAGACPQLWRVGIDGSWTQSGILTFGHALEGTDRVWEPVTEAPALTVPRSGVWVVNYQARAAATLGANASANQAAGATVGLNKDGVLIGGSEAIAIYHTLAAGDQASSMQATASRQFVHGFTAGQTVQLAAARLGSTGLVSIVSNADGRSYVTMHWIGPTGDTAS